MTRYNMLMHTLYPGTRSETLGRQLADFVPADDAEARDLAAMRGLLRGSEDPFARGSFTPGHFTASAFVTCGDALLLIWHTKLERWLQPGGHVDPEDTDLAAAAVRELREEAGITADAGGLLDVDVHRIPANPKRREPEHLHHDVRFVFTVPDRTAVAGSDAGDVKWVRLADVTEELTDASVMRAVRKLRAVGPRV